MKTMRTVIALALVIVCSARLGYIAGTKHPRVVRTQTEGVDIAFGWDSANHCVAAWWRATNGTLAWARLSEHPVLK